MTISKTTFAGLEAMHRELEDAFLCHQEALLSGELAEARRRLERFRERLERHAQIEDETLIPIYDRREREKSGLSKIFTFEHGRLLGMLVAMFESLDILIANPGGTPGQNHARGLIALFDAGAEFKALTQHHHDREENVLFPTLDREVEADERTRLLGEIWSLWER